MHMLRCLCIFYTKVEKKHVRAVQDMCKALEAIVLCAVEVTVLKLGGGFTFGISALEP